MTNEPVIELRDVSFAYDGVPVLQDVNLTICEHESVCIVGPNGGGKTTLVKLILGLLAARQRRSPRVRPSAAVRPPPHGLHAAARRSTIRSFPPPSWTSC